MLKIRFSRFLVGSVVVALIAGCASAFPSAAAEGRLGRFGSAAATAAQSQPIGVEEAKEIAFQHAGVSQSQANWSSAGLDFDHGRLTYDVNFMTGQAVYYYDIDALTGVVLDYDHKAVGSLPEGNAGMGGASGDVTQTAGALGLDAAKSIALDRAGIDAANATFIYAGRQRRGAGFVYGLKFLSGGRVYYAQVDPASGDILVFHLDTQQSFSPGAASSGADVGAESAQSAALAHAGVGTGETVFLYVTPEYEHGQRIYRADFFANQREYRYEIDAASGEIWSMYEEMHHLVNPPEGSYLNEGEIKAVVEQAAGSAGIYTKFRMDIEHERMIYEGKMKSGWVEYDFKIDAATGTILEWEID